MQTSRKFIAAHYMRLFYEGSILFFCVLGLVLAVALGAYLLDLIFPHVDKPLIPPENRQTPVGRHGQPSAIPDCWSVPLASSPAAVTLGIPLRVPKR